MRGLGLQCAGHTARHIRRNVVFVGHNAVVFNRSGSSRRRSSSVLLLPFFLLAALARPLGLPRRGVRVAHLAAQVLATAHLRLLVRKVRVLQRLLRCQTVRRVPVQQVHEQIQPERTHEVLHLVPQLRRRRRRAVLLGRREHLRRARRRRGIHVEHDRRRAEHLHGLLHELRLRRTSAEHRQPRDELVEDDADGPHVHRGAVLVREVEQRLGRAVPHGAHFRRLVVPVGAAAVVPRETEVAHLQNAVVVEQKVRRLEVAVDDPVVVEVRDGAEQLVHDALHLGRVEAHALCLEHVLEIRLDVFHHEEDLARVGRPRAHLVHAHNVGVVAAEQHVDLAEEVVREPLVLEPLRLDLLDRPNRARRRRRVLRAVHAPEAALGDGVELLEDVDGAAGADEVRVVARCGCRLRDCGCVGVGCGGGGAPHVTEHIAGRCGGGAVVVPVLF
eukprot:PhM_4_TR11614/c4_g1_i1/m.9825